MSLGRKEVFRMFEYVKWCKSTEEIAKGSCRQCAARTRRYSENKVFRIAVFERVKSMLFRTMRFLTVLPRIYRCGHNLNISVAMFRYAQFLQSVNDVDIRGVIR